MFKCLPLDTGRLSFCSIFGWFLPPLPLLRTWLFFFFNAFHFWLLFDCSIYFRFSFFALWWFDFFFDSRCTLSWRFFYFLFRCLLFRSVVPIRAWKYSVRMEFVLTVSNVSGNLCYPGSSRSHVWKLSQDILYPRWPQYVSKWPL